MDPSIIENIIEFNKKTQIETRIALCNKPSPPAHLCSAVRANTYANWYEFYTRNNNQNLFSKGPDRLDTWMRLADDHPVVYFRETFIPSTVRERDNVHQITELLSALKQEDPPVYFFVFAGLIILFQVFGDGNHRTANHFYNQITSRNISPEQMKRIDELKMDYSHFFDRRVIKDPANFLLGMIRKLMDIQRMDGGYRGKRRATSRRNKKRNSRGTISRRRRPIYK